MERVLSKDVSAHVGKQVFLQGWLHKKRLLGGLTFINLRDRAGLTQILIQDKKEVEKLRGLQIGSVLEVEGSVVEEPRAPGGAEVHEPELTVVMAVTDEPPIEIDKPIDHTPNNLDTLFDNRVISLRNLQETKIFKIRSSLVHYVRDFLYENEFTEIQTPNLLLAQLRVGLKYLKLIILVKRLR